MGHFNNIIIRPKTGEVTTSDVGTVYQDLPEKGLLSCLMVDVAAACTFSTTPGLDLHNIFTKIEVLVNGSKVIKSLDMKQARALAHYHGFDLSQLGWYSRSATSGDKTYWTIPLLFGRYPGDKEYMLDMDQYSNPQLRITYDTSQTTVDGETYYATADPYVRTGVQGLIWKGGSPGAKGYIKSTNIDTWACVASTIRTVEIPRGHKLLGVMQGARYSDDKMFDYFEKMEITYDNGDWQPINHDYQQLCTLNAMWFPKDVNINFWKDIATTYPIDSQVGEILSFNAAPVLDRASIWTITHEGSWNIQDIVGAAGMGAAHVHIRGRFPHQNLYIPFTEYSEDEDFGVDTTKWGRIDMKTTTGSGANTSAKLQTVAEYNVPNGE